MSNREIGNAEHVDWLDGSIRLDELPLPFGDFPVVVITATHADEGNVENQAFWLDISPDSVQVVLEGSHDLHPDDAGAVTDLILCMLDRVGSAGDTSRLRCTEIGQVAGAMMRRTTTLAH